MNWFLGILLDLLITVIIALLPYVFVKLLTHGEIKPKTAKILTIIFSIVSFIIFSILTLISEQTLANIIPIIIWNRVGYNLIKPIEPIEGLIKCNHCGHAQSKDIEICEVCGKLTNSEKESQLSTANKCKKIDYNTEIRELYNTYKQDKNSLEQKDIYKLSYDFKKRASKQHTALKYAEKFIISFSGDNTKFNGYLICDEENNIKEFNILNFKEQSFDITLRQNDTVYYINCELISQSDNTALQEEIKSDNIEPDKNNKKQPRFKTATIILSITTVLFAIVTLSLSVGLISQNSQKQEYITKNEELKNKYDTLQNEHYNLQTDYEELCHESDKLKAELLVNSFEHNKNKSDEEALYNEAYDDGYENGYNKGYNDGYIIGYTDAY